MAKDLVFVNERKLARAQAIVALVNGVVVPKTEDEVDTRTKFQAFFKEAEVDSKGADAIEFVYDKLGGLIRTAREQADAERKAKELRSKGKKDKLALK